MSTLKANKLETVDLPNFSINIRDIASSVDTVFHVDTITDLENLVVGTDFKDGDVYIVKEAGKGGIFVYSSAEWKRQIVIANSPDNSIWSILVANDGTLSTVKV